MSINELYLKQLIKGIREKTSLIVFLFGFFVVIFFAFNLLLSNQSNQDSLGKIFDQAAYSVIESQPDEVSDSIVYTVKPGDSLWKIALENYQDPMVWGEIYELNKETIGSNPDLILPFTQIRLPNIIDSYK